MGTMVKGYITGRLSYNSSNDRYGLLVSDVLEQDVWEHDGFHCGEGLEVMVEGQWVKTCMEMRFDRKWYLVDTPYCGELENITARIIGYIEVD